MAARRKIQVTDFDLAKAGFLYNFDHKGRYYHFRNLVDMVWRDSPVEWNPWLEDQMQSLCDDTYLTKLGETTVRTVAWTGPGSAGKTFSSGLYAMTWFLVYPEKSSVALTSTSKKAMGGRVWAVIKDLFISGFHPDTGEPFDWHIINSQKELQWPRGDEKHSIACFAVEEGELLKSIDKIKGRHTERMLLIVDEANSTPDAIYNTIPNQLKGCKEHVTLTIGNAVSFFDNHGRACEPKDGWNSVTVEDSKWPTKGVNQWRLAPGICCHYDGQKSPNSIAGKTIWPHIYSYEDWQEALKWGETSMHYWSQDRGFWAPEGTVSTVFSDPLINRCDGQGFLNFYSTRDVYAFLDPGFGGDRCVLKFADVGEIEVGKIGIQLRPVIFIEPKVLNEAERDYQIARQTIEECRSRGVKPHHFGSDATAIGRGVHAIIAGEWSSEVHRVEWGGKASDKPSSQADGRPAVEVYANQVTELWFTVREFLEAGQLKGMSVEEIKQACSREYEQQGRRYLLNSKPECKKKLGYSPDEMDATAGLCEVVKRNGINAQGRIAALQSESWQDTLQSVEKELALVEPDGIKDAGGWAERDFGIDWQGDEGDR